MHTHCCHYLQPAISRCAVWTKAALTHNTNISRTELHDDLSGRVGGARSYSTRAEVGLHAGPNSFLPSFRAGSHFVGVHPRSTALTDGYTSVAATCLPQNTLRAHGHPPSASALSRRAWITVPFLGPSAKSSDFTSFRPLRRHQHVIHHVTPEARACSAAQSCAPVA